MSKAKELFEKMSGLSTEEVTDTLLDGGEALGSFIPYINGALNLMRFKRIEGRLKVNEAKINIITDRLSYHEDVFYKQEVFPIIFNWILNEDQEEKIPIILQGFEHILDEEIKDLEEVYHYYDVLSELRISDIMFLTESYELAYPNYDKPLKIKPIKLRVMDPERYDKQKDFEGYISNKLLRLGIFQYSRETNNGVLKYEDSIDNYLGNVNRQPLLIADLEFSNFGLRFIKFFSSEDE